MMKQTILLFTTILITAWPGLFAQPAHDNLCNARSLTISETCNGASNIDTNLAPIFFVE